MILSSILKLRSTSKGMFKFKAFYVFKEFIAIDFLFYSRKHTHLFFLKACELIIAQEE
ncbi:hypothetical protein PI23P_09520 [Polaribacter irgensii 23-P]|uniref:Uncharacterized protein n=1 Tax=Polaribacter irgensii 23-P TaxID=313594 RepID=A4C0B3_9FLAO|nr:hypothetical protein PI23P_09520 [Polaribacter irgensii 23-P]